jgi:hypothetical protein
MADKTKKTYPLIRAVVSMLWWQFVGVIPTRLFFIVGLYAQAIVMSAAIGYMETPSHQRQPNHAYALIAATILSYYGATVSSLPSSICICLPRNQVWLRPVSVQIISYTFYFSWWYGWFDISLYFVNQFW